MCISKFKVGLYISLEMILSRIVTSWVGWEWTGFGVDAWQGKVKIGCGSKKK